MLSNYKPLSASICAFHLYGKLPTIISFLLVGIIVVQMISVVHKDSSPVKQMPSSLNLSKISTSDERGSASINEVSNWHLFGEIPQVEKEADLSTLTTINVDTSPIEYKLKGVLLSSDLVDSKIVLTDKLGNDSVYDLNTVLSDGGEIEAVYPNYVVIKRNAQLQKIYFSNVKKNIDEMDSSAGRAFKQKASSAINEQESRLSLSSMILEEIESIRVERNPSAGQKLYTIAEQLRMLPTDLVVSINRIRLENFQNIKEIMDDMSDLSVIDITISRNGNEEGYHLELY